MSKSGVCDLAPISFFTAVGRVPPTISMSLQPKSDGMTLKDAFVNIRDTGEFVVNMINLPHIERVHETAFEFPTEFAEFEAVRDNSQSDDQRAGTDPGARRAFSAAGASRGTSGAVPCRRRSSMPDTVAA